MADYRVAAHRSAAHPTGYHKHVYPGGRTVVVKGPHTAAEGGGGGAGGGGVDTSGVSGAPPIDPELEAKRAVTAQQLAIGNAQDVYDTTKTSQEYGITDASNPYSKAKMLEQSYRRAQGSTEGSMAAKGQLYSGAMQTAQNENTFQYAKGSDELQRAYQSAIMNIQKRKADRYGAAGQTLDESSYNSLIKALGS